MYSFFGSYKMAQASIQDKKLAETILHAQRDLML